MADKTYSVRYQIRSTKDRRKWTDREVACVDSAHAEREYKELSAHKRVKKLRVVVNDHDPETTGLLF